MGRIRPGYPKQPVSCEHQLQHSVGWMYGTISPYTNPLHFYGYEGAGFNSPTVVYTVVLQGVTAGADLVLDLDDTDDKFATFMLGPTNMLYGNALTDGTVTVIGKQAAVTAKVTLQGRSDNTGALLTFTPGTLMGYSYSGTSNYWGNISLANVVDDTYPITIDKANYLAVTANSLKSVAISSSKTSLTTINAAGWKRYRSSWFCRRGNLTCWTHLR